MKSLRIADISRMSTVTAGLEIIELSAIPRTPDGNSLIDLYVHLPSSSRYLLYVASGDEISDRKIEALKTHVSPHFYYNPSSLPKETLTPSSSESSPAPATAPDSNSDTAPASTLGAQPDYFRSEIIGEAAQENLKRVFKSLLSTDMNDVVTVLKTMESMSDGIINEVAPDSKKIKQYLLKYSKHLDIMNDSSAITTLAVMFAMANGFDSRKSYKELTYATLVMDISMTEFSQEELFIFYTDFENASDELKHKVFQHPVRSHALASEKLNSLSEATLGLILNHHELFSGKGYPRGIRTESLFPMARILSLAVDVFERLKKAALLKQSKTLMEVLVELQSNPAEAHLRRHNKKLVDTAIEFLNSPDTSTSEAEPEINSEKS